MQREKAILVRLSKQEKTIFEIMAGKKGLKIAAYIRMIILDLYYESKKEHAETH
jgi:predicted DNA binding CopG/RHH family protein